MKRKLNEHDVPMPKDDGESSEAATLSPTFAGLGLDTRITQATTREQFRAPTPIQSQAIPLALAGRHILARSKTGSGKTLAYLLPIIHAVLQHKTADKRAQSSAALILVPSKELASQLAETVKKFTAFCAQDVRCENVTRKEDAAVTKARLAECPDIIIATPAGANHWINDEVLKVDSLRYLVIDEADLVLSYGYEEDLQTIAQALPAGIQKLMMSATLRTEVDTLTSLFFPKGTAEPELLDLSAEEALETPALAQYSVRTAEDEKFLLIYAIFKLQLIKGKIIIFVADIDRCYRIKLFLEQFGIRSCVLNSELPVNSRLHIVEEFNRGVYDIIIAADEDQIVGNENNRRKRRKVELATGKELEGPTQVAADEETSTGGTTVDAKEDSGDEAPTEAIEAPKPAKKQHAKKRNRPDQEYGVARGIDFRHVTCVLNFDLPLTAKSYTHRIGRTARAGQSGMALSFFVPKELFRRHKPTSIPQCAQDEEILKSISSEQAGKGTELKQWGLDWAKLDGFRYRLADALRSVTRIAVREARTKELRNELIKSEKLKRHFEENPDDLKHLRHDTDTHAIRQQPHLRHVPDYLLPSGGKAAVSKDVGFVSFKKDLRHANGFKKAKATNKSRSNGKFGKHKGLDPLKSLNARGRKKK